MKEEIWNNIIKRLSGEETKSDKEVLDLWLAENPTHEQKYNEVAYLWQLTGKLSPEQTNKVPDLNLESREVKTSPKLSTYFKFGIAAACAAVLFIFGLKALDKNQAGGLQQWASFTAKPEKIVSLMLPDSSIVVLNAGSTIKYAKNFTKQKKRIVQLSGEAFFEVKHNAQKPFVVESGPIKTVVFGTSFNVRAYGNEKDIKIGVKSGRVGVLKNETGNKSIPIFLTKNSSLHFNTQEKSFSQVLALTSEADNWTQGNLIFEQTPILDVLATLSRRFGVKFNTTQYRHPSCKLTASFGKKDLPAILKTIKTILNIKINQIDQTIYVEGGKPCN